MSLRSTRTESRRGFFFFSFLYVIDFGLDSVVRHFIVCEDGSRCDVARLRGI